MLYFLLEKSDVMDKKTIIRGSFTILLFVLLAFGYALRASDFSIQKVTKDEERFKKEYESFNGKKREGKDYKNIDVYIPSDNSIVYASEKQILDLLENGTGIIYFGFPDCPWCRNVAPILIDAAKEEDIDKIYYYNAQEDRDEKKLVDGKIEEMKKGSSFYVNLMEKLGDKASKYDGLDDENIKRLYFPTILFVKEGEIVLFHEGTVPSQLNPLVKLNQRQETELREILIDGMNMIYGDTCDDKC